MAGHSGWKQQSTHGQPVPTVTSRRIDSYVTIRISVFGSAVMFIHDPNMYETHREVCFVIRWLCSEIGC